jgi:hypothetical protein
VQFIEALVVVLTLRFNLAIVMKRLEAQFQLKHLIQQQ